MFYRDQKKYAVVDRWALQAVGATVVVMRAPRAAEAAVGDRWQVGSSGGGGDCGGGVRFFRRPCLAGCSVG